jgi:tetratricopeptide (TPR) repeat protein
MHFKPILVRFAIFLAAFWLARWGFYKIAASENPASVFIYVILLGCICAVLVVKYVLPWIGDAVSTSVFSSGEVVRPDESMKAAAKVAQGDYEGAIVEHEKALAENPKQSFAVAEIAKICSLKLGDPQRALRVLEERLAGTEWSEDDAAFLRFRIVDICTEDLQDYEKAREVLQQVIANFPNTRHSANAHHKLGEVEQAQFKALQAQRTKPASGGTA